MKKKLNFLVLTLTLVMFIATQPIAILSVSASPATCQHNNKYEGVTILGHWSYDHTHTGGFKCHVIGEAIGVGIYCRDCGERIDYYEKETETHYYNKP